MDAYKVYSAAHKQAKQNGSTAEEAKEAGNNARKQSLTQHLFCSRIAELHFLNVLTEMV